jgi:hypothetical protein
MVCEIASRRRLADKSELPPTRLDASADNGRGFLPILTPMTLRWLWSKYHPHPPVVGVRCEACIQSR